MAPELAVSDRTPPVSSTPPSDPPRLTLPRQPREPRLTGSGSLIVVLRLFAVPMFLFGAVLVLLLVREVAWGALGSVHAARVVRVWAPADKDDDETAECVVLWEHRYYGRHVSGLESFHCEFEDELSRPGAVVMVRTLRLGPLSYTALVPAVRASVFQVGPLLFMSAFMGAVIAAFVKSGFYDPARERWLYQWGYEIQGEITGMECDDSAVHLQYRFEPPDRSPQTGALAAHVLPSARGDFQVGGRLLILYDPQHPERHVAHDHGSFTVR